MNSCNLACISIKSIPAIKGIRETFNKSAIVDFTKFCNSIGRCDAWMVASDYVFRDGNRKYDTMAFAIIPVVKDVIAFRDEIENVEKQDLKRRKKIKNDFVNLLKSNKVFHVVLNFEKSYLLGDDLASELKNMTMILQSFENAFPILERGVGDALQKSQIGLAKKSIGLLNAELAKGMTNDKVSMVREVLTLVNVLGFLVSVIHSAGGGKIVTLLPDRDPIYDLVGTGSDAYFPQMTLMMANAFVTAYCHGSGYVDVVCAVPPNTGAVWSDPLNRLADYFAGAFARLETEKVMQDKVLNKLIVDYGFDNEKVVVLNVGNTCVSRYDFNVVW